MNDVEYDQWFKQPKVVWEAAENRFVQVVDPETGPVWTHFCGPFQGFVQYRKLVPHEEDFGTYLASLAA
jgi:hypothetical protein